MEMIRLWARARLQTGAPDAHRATEAVIGADGVLSEVAAAGGMTPAPRVAILQAEVRLPENWDPTLTQVWFDTDDTRFFYWLIPESKEKGVIGLIGDRRAPLGAMLKRFLLRLKLKPEAYQAAQVAMHHPKLRPWTRIGRTPVYLVGDAAGQVKVTTVGGTVTGLAGARAAARAILKGTAYGKELRALKRELDVHWVIRAMLDRLDNRGYDHLVGAISEKVQGFLGKPNRDSMAGVFWKLPLIEPRLLRVGLRCLKGAEDAASESHESHE